jgi:hypothetical protein
MLNATSTKPILVTALELVHDAVSLLNDADTDESQPR